MADSAELLESCQSVHWYASPEEVLRTPAVYLRHVMMYGLAKDRAVAAKHFSRQDWKAALDAAPAGFFSPKKWRYWQRELGGDPETPLPRRFAFSKDWWLDGIQTNGRTPSRSR